MPKPRHTIRPVRLHIALPEDVAARLDLMLYSEVEQRVPFGARSDYICNLIRKDLEARYAKS